MASKADLKNGQRVTFRRSHDKTIELTGKIVGISPDEDVVQIKTEPDGKIAEVSTLETAHVADVTVIQKAGKPNASEKETASKNDAKANGNQAAQNNDAPTADDETEKSAAQ